MTLSEHAYSMFQAGMSEEEVRSELRGLNAYGECPTCGAVEEAIHSALSSIKPEVISIKMSMRRMTP